VAEGDRVRENDVLANLDQSVLAASLMIAKASMESRGQLETAVAERRLRKDRLEKLKALREGNHASQEEIDRAATEYAVAEAQVLAAEEAMRIRQLEHDRIQVQIERRMVRSPVDGVVIEFQKEPGEYVSPTDAVVATVVQLDQLLAVFSVPANLAGAMTNGQEVRVLFSGAKTAAPGKLAFVSPVTNAQSATVKVKVQIDNKEGQYRAGEKCTLLLADRPTQLTSKPEAQAGSL
jgi:RND family efflux transporter MFP subunit